MTFEEYVRKRIGALLGLAVAVAGDRHVAEDVVQDVLLKAQMRWAAIEQLDDPHAYVRRMVVTEHRPHRPRDNGRRRSLHDECARRPARPAAPPLMRSWLAFAFGLAVVVVVAVWVLSATPLASTAMR